MRPVFDKRDGEIVRERLRAMDERPGARMGDYVRFACGTLRRISHVWWAGEPDTAVQTSAGGSWYLGEAGCSFSGSLFRSVPLDSLTLTDEQMQGRVWIFHHGWAQAHSAVHATVPFRVFTCDREAPR